MTKDDAPRPPTPSATMLGLDLDTIVAPDGRDGGSMLKRRRPD